RGLQIGAHARDQRSDHPHVTHGLVADLPHGGVGDAFLEASSQQPQCRAGRADASVVQAYRGDVGQGVAGLANEVGGWHFHILEVQLRFSSVVPHLRSARDTIAWTVRTPVKADDALPKASFSKPNVTISHPWPPYSGGRLQPR